VAGRGHERMRELRRRRHRRKKVSILTRKSKKASGADRVIIAEKLRKLTPGSEVIIERLKLEA
jgi:hypothetical protein